MLYTAETMETRQLLDHPLLSGDENRELAIKAQNGDKQARDRLILHNQRLISEIARKYARMAGGLAFDDLLQTGNEGLLVAIRKYDPRRNEEFTTYAYWWIRSKIIRYCYDHAHTIHIANHAVQKLHRARKAITKLSLEHGQRPTIADIAHESGLQPDLVRKVLTAAQVTTLDNGLDDDDQGDAPRAETVSLDDKDTTENTVLDHILLERAISQLDGLPDRTRLLLLDRFGFNARQHPLTYKQIAHKYHISESAARKRVQRGLDLLRDLLT